MSDHDGNPTCRPARRRRVIHDESREFALRMARWHPTTGNPRYTPAAVLLGVDGHVATSWCSERRASAIDAWGLVPDESHASCGGCVGRVIGGRPGQPPGPAGLAELRRFWSELYDDYFDPALPESFEPRTLAPLREHQESRLIVPDPLFTKLGVAVNHFGFLHAYGIQRGVFERHLQRFGLQWNARWEVFGRVVEHLGPERVGPLREIWMTLFDAAFEDVANAHRDAAVIPFPRPD